MPRVEVTPYQNETVNVNGYEVALEAHRDTFSIGLQPDVTLAEAWATIGPTLSRGNPGAQAVCEHRIPGEKQIMTQREAIENIWKFSLNQDLLDRLRLKFSEHMFTWERSDDVPYLEIAFKKFEPASIDKVLSVGK